MARDGAIVCVVDDDAAVRGALKFALELEGLKVRVYDGARAVLDDPQLPRDGCLIIDYRMPDMDGMELVDVLRARAVGLPAIIITGHADARLRRHAERTKVDHILEKPLSDSSLVDAVRSALAAGA
jgi:FixJ family two-component response regulator